MFDNKDSKKAEGSRMQHDSSLENTVILSDAPDKAAVSDETRVYPRGGFLNPQATEKIDTKNIRQQADQFQHTGDTGRFNTGDFKDMDFSSDPFENPIMEPETYESEDGYCTYQDGSPNAGVAYDEPSYRFQAQEAGTEERDLNMEEEKRPKWSDMIMESQMVMPKNMAPIQRIHKIGVLDVLITLLGLMIIGVSVMLFKSMGGIHLISQFAATDLPIVMEHLTDFGYFKENLTFTIRLASEIGAVASLMMIILTVFVILHCFWKNQILSIIKGILLTAGSFVSVFYIAGYMLISMIVVLGISLVTTGSSSMDGPVFIAIIAVIATSVLWFLYMLVWGITSLFPGFNIGILTILIVLFVVSGCAMVVTVGAAFFSLQAFSNFISVSQLLKIFTVPALICGFMLLCMLAAVEDYRAKRLVEVQFR